MDYNVSKRVKKLRKMDENIRNISNEDYYIAWIFIVPDEATLDDWLDIAEDDALYIEVLETYAMLMNRAIAYKEV